MGSSAIYSGILAFLEDKNGWERHQADEWR